MSNFNFGTDSFHEENQQQNLTFTNITDLDSWKCSFLSFEEFESLKKDPNGFEKIVQKAEEKIKDSEANLNKTTAEIEEKMMLSGMNFHINFFRSFFQFSRTKK